MKSKIIKFADEAAFKQSNDISVSADFILRQIEDFFQTRRSIVLVDLDKIFPRVLHEEILVTEPEPVVEPEVKKPSYIEDDPNYVPPPSEISADAQKIID